MYYLNFNKWKIPDLLFDYSRVLEYAKIRTVLQSTFDPFVGTLTTKNMASYTSPQLLRIFSTMLAQKYKIWRSELSEWTK